VLVFTDEERSMGIAVDQIVDIVEEALDIEIMTDTPGRLGSAIIGGRATEIIDVAHYLPQAFDDWLTHKERKLTQQTRRLLLVDDSAFFRNMLSPLLSAAGYAVTLASSAEEALAMRDRGMRFDLIVSDLEMPGMDGIQFAHEVQSDATWSATPLVALSSHRAQAVIERTRAAGFADYVGKFDREGLIESLKGFAPKLEEAA
jgi:two-component system chemotaxis sensor kinase CheA